MGLNLQLIHYESELSTSLPSIDNYIKHLQGGPAF